jgi:hypothetical protein
MNPSDTELAKVLRDLAARGPQQAPPELGRKLENAFVRHHAHRRRRRAAWLVSLATCAVLAVVLLLARRSPAPSQTATILPPAQAQSAPATATAPPAQAVAQSKPTSKLRARRRVAGARVAATADFVALPSFDSALPISQSQIVRVEMPASDLQLVGFPVDGDLMQRRIVADVLVGHDGVPLAVRLVRTDLAH